MCTIGSSYYDINGYKSFTMFKQCDLVDKTDFFVPNTKISDEGIRYFPLTRKKNDCSTPAWAGINEYGVCFVAADSYLSEDNKRTNASVNSSSVFEMYENTIKNYKCAKDAADYAVDFYKNTFKEPDIFMVGDINSCYFIEAYNGNVCCIERKSGFFTSTNHFRMIYGGVPFEQNHSTYLRLNRAEQILNVNADFNGIGHVLRDQYYGKSVWSICRSKDIKVAEEEEYYTQASVMFHMEENAKSEKPSIFVEYIINGNPSEEGKCKVCMPFNDEKTISVNYIGNYDDLSRVQMI